MTRTEIDNYINKKIDGNDKYIIFRYYEIRIKLNLSSNETFNLLHIAREKLEKLNYRIYTTGQEYFYEGTRKVQDNELMVAIKNNCNI